MSDTTELFNLFKTERSMVSLKPKIKNNSNWGTFKDSLRAPVHSWFPYPAGFSYKAVEHAIQKFSINQFDVVYDPFCGSGTTNIVANQLGINSIGVEAHPFIYLVVKTKMYSSYDYNIIFDGLKKIENISRQIVISQEELTREFPELVLKCFSGKTLGSLYSLREAMKKVNFSEVYANFFNLALTCILRPAANVGTGWPYIAPNKKKNGGEKNISELFKKMVFKMCADIQLMKQKRAVDAWYRIYRG